MLRRTQSLLTDGIDWILTQLLPLLNFSELPTILLHDGHDLPHRLGGMILGLVLIHHKLQLSHLTLELSELLLVGSQLL
ncbi:uncharacterized protein PgNI_11791, partial [Pyricularia grisea]|uniref:Uncharacterized protein n=1 Tax=Pyricularia grisea TaxID=148305 RepID=A0A6P8ANJ9_PYRGI